MNKTLKDEIEDCNYPEFSSQDDAVDFVRKMIKHYVSKSKIITLDDAIFSKLYCLFKCHPDFFRKLPNGETVVGFRVFYNHYGNLATNYIVDVGWENDFSWQNCAKNLVRIEKGQVTDKVIKRYVRHYVINALHNAVQSQLVQFKTDYEQQHNGHFYDALTHEELNKNDVDVDHKEKPFCEIVDEWLDTIGGLDNAKIQDTINSQCGFVMSDSDQKKSWQNYHKANAQYQILSHHNNRSKGSNGYKMKH